MRSDNANPARAIIARLGGIRALARLLGLPPTTIQGWHERGTIPARRQEDVLRAAERANVGLRPADFFAAAMDAEQGPAVIDAFEVLSVAEMGEADRLTIAAGTPGIMLMQAAGRAVADEVQRRCPTEPVIILCGPGNNGGDGFVAARLLSEAGRSVRVALLGERAALKGDAAIAASTWSGDVLPLGPEVLLDGAVVVDALFGAGLSRPLDGVALDVVREVNRRRLPVIAVDLPSGVNGDSGIVLGSPEDVPSAVATVTFFRKKPAHLLVPSRELCGDIVVADIGIPESVLDTIRPRAAENAPPLWTDRFPWPRLSSHKYSRGHAVVVGGAVMTGAARLAARASQRIGAGLVTVAAPADAIPIYAATNAGLLTTPIGHPADFATLLDDVRKNAVLLGPGNGATDATRAHVLLALEADRRCVLDADALTVFANRPQDLIAALKRAGERLGTPAAVLTPHDGEFARLFRRADSVDIDADKLARARAAAAVTGAVVLLKGADTVIAHPDGRVRINANAPATLATAGAGDVLAGLIVGLLAQGMDAVDAASAGAWIHGAAAAAFGPGLIAEDLPELVPGVLREIRKPA
ncbi:MAG TPA: NAD(P)H-hydrate dehydratase [Alphaproteobacteria bacterium]|jgi:NAD(P)H-hydrate epimerase|nr:NAD(P)H-hydrate dehydratase [Alphaproteobacteria bacterium]